MKFFFLFFVAALAQQLNVPLAPQKLLEAGIPVVPFENGISSTQSSFGPRTLMTSAQIDVVAGTITLPLYKGSMGQSGSASSQDIWYILTDASDMQVAQSFGINFSYKLGLLPSTLTRSATLSANSTFIFEAGTVDFTPDLFLPTFNSNGANGENVFELPLPGGRAGSIADDSYFPWVRVTGTNWVFNAPIIASAASGFDLANSNQFCLTGQSNSQSTARLPQSAYRFLHDKVVSFCPLSNTVTLRLDVGLSFASPIYYLSLDSNDMSFATMENTTFVPSMANSSISCFELNSLFCASEGVVSVTNGITNQDIQTNQTSQPGQSNLIVNPLRQGLNSALLDHLPALNVFGETPNLSTGSRYSPIGDIWLVKWNDFAVQNHLRFRIPDIHTTYGLFQIGWISGFQSTSIASSGIWINAPIVWVFH